MEVKNQIRAYRSGLGMSQEELAEAVYVTRQTDSNWETGKSYPDIQSLLRLSALFGISLDQLIKGDVEQMKEKINAEEIQAFNRLSNVFTLMMVLSLLVWAPLAYFLGWWGIALAAVLFAFTLWLAFRVEKEKKKYDIQSYKEIVAFLEGRRLDEISKAQEVAKRPYQKVLLTLGSAALAAGVTAGLFWLFTIIF
ncbi:MAG: helix-turn-helix domain-containing protein [Candidatus Limivicinus sp.]|nr:helix-turn-helix domain-containing protein [Candidatus Limivicinus sp.]